MAGRTPDREYVAPVQTLRVRYAKRGRFRFASHRDFQRALERALRRAQVPMAYSAGFSPHPKISYAGAAPTGAASEAEYLEIGVLQPQDPARVARDVDAVLPDGMDIVDVAEAAGGSLQDVLQASRWLLEWQSDATEAAARFLAAGSVLVPRVTKSGRRELDVRAACLALDVPGPGRMEVTIRHGAPTPRPGDLVAGIRSLSPEVPDLPVLATRLAQGPLVADASIGDPLHL